ncbi:MAG TPA: c-type cytochrome [Vicinamibacterales bacterium]|nr:c-type cytochrome [Vicinamibacterales bacterium]
MRNLVLAAAAALFVSSIYSGVGAQQPPVQQPPVQQPPAGQPPGGGRGRGGQGFPAQQRPLASPEVIERGGTLYGINCRLCHGADLRGGDLGGINLLRSQLVLNDQNGELIYPVVHEGRNKPGLPAMPPLPLSEPDVQAIAAYIHSVAARMAGQGGPPPPGTAAMELNIVVGNAAAGQKYFAANCASCHSVDGDLRGIASRYSSPMMLQNAWVAGGNAGGRGFGGGRGGPGGGGGGDDAAPARAAKPVTVTVTTADGQRYEGRLDRIDDFYVSLIQSDGTTKVLRRNGSVPAVQITDPLEGHKKLLVKYTDKDIHDVTAYLVTLK